jgi:tRNA (guanine37-N1)-methyltransferase
VKVSKDRGESMRKKLLQLGQLDKSLKIKRDGTSVIIPIVASGPGTLDVDFEYEFVEEDLEERTPKTVDYRKRVDISTDLVALLPTSFDVIGDIVVIRLVDQLTPYREMIGNALLSTHPRLRTVALDRGVKGERRVRDLEVISGDDSTDTVHVESGLRLKVDLRKAYFNPRLASERERIASLVSKGEVVTDMFAGVGPFSIMIAKHAEPKIVYAIDVNKDAVEFLRTNIAMNRIKNVVPIWGDARTIIPTLPPSDRIIMNLPHSALEFLSDALRQLNIGGTIHFYFVSERSSYHDMVGVVTARAQEIGKKVEMTRIEELKTYSPSSSVFSADIILVNGS